MLNQSNGDLLIAGCVGPATYGLVIDVSLDEFDSLDGEDPERGLLIAQSGLNTD
jgi:hypothetical protein